MSINKLHSEKYTLPVVALLKVPDGWRVSLNDAEGKFSFRREPSPSYRTVDAFSVRDEFFKLKTPQEALAFFRQYGPFELCGEDIHKSKSKGLLSRANPVRWETIRNCQDEFESALQGKAPRREFYQFAFERPLLFEVGFQTVTPRIMKAVPEWINDGAVVNCEGVVEALRATVFLSLMRGFKFKRCARAGCDSLFELKTRRQKIFCSDACAHLQAVNNYNSKKKQISKKKRRIA